MATSVETSDRVILDLLHRGGPSSVTQLAVSTGVTATAVRQRLVRLMGQDLVERVVNRAGRGRPGHHYSLTDRAKRQAGSNFADLAIALWEEIRSVPDPEVRRGLLTRLAKRLASIYADKITGTTLADRMESVQELFGQRNVAMEVDRSGELPVLKAHSCPYPELAEHDRGICSMEKILFSELLGREFAGAGVRLSECRLDGDSCCTFATH